MLRGWTRRGRREMIGELALLTRHAEVLASQERATGGSAAAKAINDFLQRAKPVLAALNSDAAADVPRRELSTLLDMAVRQVARAEREIGSKPMIHTQSGQERA